MNWEYKILSISPTQDRLNELGFDCWELIDTAPDRLIFKRPKRVDVKTDSNFGYRQIRKSSFDE